MYVLMYDVRYATNTRRDSANRPYLVVRHYCVPHSLVPRGGQEGCGHTRTRHVLAITDNQLPYDNGGYVYKY